MASTGLKPMVIVVLALFTALIHGWGGIQYCGASSFINRVSDASPLIDDCKTLMTKLQYIMGRPDSWGIGNCQQRVLAEWGTCKFGIEQAEPHLTCKWGENPMVARVGFGDMVYAINESIIRFGTNGRVGTEGFFVCNPDTGYVAHNMQWGLY